MGIAPYAITRTACRRADRVVRPYKTGRRIPRTIVPPRFVPYKRCQKKNRPGAVLTVLCRRADQPALEALIFAETTTIGIRSFPVDRAVLPRSFETVATPWGPAKIKVTIRDGQRRGIPEFDTVDQLAQSAGVPFPDVYAAVLSAWQAQK